MLMKLKMGLLKKIIIIFLAIFLAIITTSFGLGVRVAQGGGECKEGSCGEAGKTEEESKKEPKKDETKSVKKETPKVTEEKKDEAKQDSKKEEGKKDDKKEEIVVCGIKEKNELDELKKRVDGIGNKVEALEKNMDELLLVNEHLAQGFAELQKNMKLTQLTMQIHSPEASPEELKQMSEQTIKPELVRLNQTMNELVAHVTLKRGRLGQIQSQIRVTRDEKKRKDFEVEQKTLEDELKNLIFVHKTITQDFNRLANLDKSIAHRLSAQPSVDQNQRQDVPRQTNQTSVGHEQSTQILPPALSGMSANELYRRGGMNFIIAMIRQMNTQTQQQPVIQQTERAPQPTRSHGPRTGRGGRSMTAEVVPVSNSIADLIDVDKE